MVADLNAQPPVAPATLLESARFLTATASGDARSYSLLGELAARSGQRQAADALFAEALKHSKTEYLALTNTINERLAAHDITGALPFADLLLRRWTDRWSAVAPLIVAAAGAPDGRQSLQAALTVNPPWRGRAIAELVKHEETLGFVRDLLSASASHGQPPATADLESLIRAYVGFKSYGAAYRLFLATLTEAEKPLSGYVYDADFTTPPSGRFFGWRGGDNASVSVTWPVSEPDGGLRLRFLNSPARLGSISQTLSLSAGNYRLEVVAEAAQLKAPKSLYWQITCNSRFSLLTSVAVDPGTYQNRTFAADFTIPAADCGLQTLALQTDVRTNSWRDLYAGEVTFRQAKVTRAVPAA